MASTAIAIRDQSTAVAPKYTPEQVQLLIDTVAKGCDENEFKLFLEIAKLSRLNPFTGQIRPVKRWNSDLGRNAMVVQTGIDGYRAIASRTNELAGIDDAIFDTESEDHPNWAKVTVYRWSHGEKIPYTATARWSEYVQKKKDGEPNSMWTRMPYLMLAKCSEALALRKAFPDELAAVYTDEEMGQADNPEPKPLKPPVTQPKRASERLVAEQQEEQRKPEGEVISGIIENAKLAKSGALWITVDKKLVVVDSAKIDDGMVEGSRITLRAVEMQNEKIGKYYAIKAVLENPPEERNAKAVEGEVLPPDPGMEEAANALEGMFEAGSVKKASELPKEGNGKKPGTIGKGRAQSLWIIMSKNAKETGLTEALVRERILAKLPNPIEHLSDLEAGMEDAFKKMFRGEIPWKDFVDAE